MGKSEHTNTSETVDSNAGGHLCLQVSPSLVPIFFQLLGEGFSLNIQTGVTVKDLICKKLGIREDYLAQRIQTIFLNARVVDDIDAARVAEDSTLALSGAMPGLVGAILRSGGYLAAMRNQLSHAESQLTFHVQSAKVTIKLMNIVAKELGPVFLQKGIWLKGPILGEFVKRRADDLKAGCNLCQLDGQSIELTDLPVTDWRDEMMMLLQVSSDKVS